LGEFQGRRRSEVNETESKDEESMKALYERAEKFLHKILSKHYQDTVLFVGHNGINKAIIAVITGKKHEDLKSMEKQHNTSVNIFEIDEDKNHVMHVFNCIKHLA
jgi:broad specificity phosphatase PhoE